MRPLADVPMREILECNEKVLTLGLFFSFLWSFDLVLNINEWGVGVHTTC